MILWTIIFILFGLTMLVGGIQLALLGGSWYYMLAGATMVIVAVLIKPRRPAAQLLYALLLLVTAMWAFWEVGFDWWPLASRLGVLLLLAIPLLFPGRGNPRWGAISLAVAWVGVGLFTLASIPYDAHKIEGELPTASAITEPRLGDVPKEDWLSYGRSKLGQRYSPLEQITPENVDQLELAWEYQTGDRKGPNDVVETTYEATPLKAGNTLYLCTPHNWLVALDADTGKERWVYDAQVAPESQRQHQTCRGVSYLPPEQGDAPQVETLDSPAEEQESVECDAQLFLPTSDARLLALDPATGAKCSNFADNGELNLLHNMPYPHDGFYYSTSPPIVANGVVVVAGAVNDLTL